MKKIVSLFLLVLAGCFQASSDEDDLRIVPITNNPYVVPNHGGGIPGMSTGGAGGPH
jgi:hypothetical protein